VRTTPEGTDLQRLLRRMHTRGVDAVAMEVSSHGLDLRRVDGTRFAVAVYTNLSQDHLDWHGSMEAYLAAKARLFLPAFAPRGVVFLDGPWARRLLALVRIPVTTVGTDADADVRLVDVELSVDGGRGTRCAGTTRHDRAAHPPARPVQPRQRRQRARRRRDRRRAAATAAAGIAACPGAPGRLERVERGQPFTVLVDYAHTPEAVAQVVTTLRSLGAGRVLVVLGAGGDRDRGKRAAMGAAAATADVAVLTSDNPRSEDPARILAAVATGAREAVAPGRRPSSSSSSIGGGRSQRAGPGAATGTSS
jgi:UDP-N-acetylmuramoyl-L-alanyl-D-glutamate--2,6-diaminopimelate ligase